MKHIVIYLVFLGCTTVASGQAWQAGIGFQFDAFTLRQGTPQFISDSIFFQDTENLVSNPLQGQPRNDPSITLFASKRLLDHESFSIVGAMHFNRQYISIQINRLLDDPGRIGYFGHIPITSVYSFVFPVNFTFQPFSSFPNIGRRKPFWNKLQVFGGLGPGIHFRREISLFDFRMPLENNRFDTFYAEVYNQFQNESHRNFTLSYNFGIELSLHKSLGLRLVSSGSVGSVMKGFEAQGKKLFVPILRRSLGIFLTYDFGNTSSSKEEQQILR